MAESKNYITAAGFAQLKKELHRLLHEERPEVVRVVSWAASNGDRSENGDYIYGKRKLREIDRRIRFLTQRLESAEVVRARARRQNASFLGRPLPWKGKTAKNGRSRLSGLTRPTSPVGRSVGSVRSQKFCWEP